MTSVAGYWRRQSGSPLTRGPDGRTSRAFLLEFRAERACGTHGIPGFGTPRNTHRMNSRGAAGTRDRPTGRTTTYVRHYTPRTASVRRTPPGRSGSARASGVNRIAWLPGSSGRFPGAGMILIPPRTQTLHHTQDRSIGGLDPYPRNDAPAQPLSIR